MTFIGMNTVQFYQPEKAVGRRKDGRPAISNLRVPTACGKGNTPLAPGSGKAWSQILQNCDLIEIVDTASPPSEKPFNLLQGRAPELGRTEKGAEGTVLRRYFW